ncbi:MAG TPA: glycosyltransferase [Xanthobacteraceae bacterium]|nr:glycosyltransferase [Xanthobacteraceae bacterium]
MRRSRICLLHPFDPRGSQIGGIETCIRDLIAFHPPDVDVLLIGVDGRGDLDLGETHWCRFRERTFQFLPILHYPDERARDAITAPFSMALLRRFAMIARAVRSRACSLDLRRVEYAWVPTALGAPFIQTLHGDGAWEPTHDSPLTRHRLVRQVGERFAMAMSRKFLCANPLITERLRQVYPRHRGKIETLWSWADTDVFRPQPLPDASDAFRIAFAGRLDAGKNLPLMFKTVAALRARLQEKLEFHYVGTSNPARFPEFAAIADITIRHGFKDAAGLAETLAHVHAGILTSRHGGTPRCVLETLAVGRPVVAMHLPQLETVIQDHESGFLVRGGVPQHELAERLADKFIALRAAILRGEIDPHAVARKIDPFTPRTQLARVFHFHREIQRSGARPAMRAARTAY